MSGIREVRIYSLDDDNRKIAYLIRCQRRVDETIHLDNTTAFRWSMAFPSALIMEFFLVLFEMDLSEREIYYGKRHYV